MTTDDTTKLVHGVGVSLRSQHFNEFLQSKQPIDWLEIVADQFIATHGILRDKLINITNDYPVNLHCVSMSIAGSDPLNDDYLNHIKNLRDLLQPQYISDHLCWSSHQQHYSHDLLPFPYHKHYLPYIANRIQSIQERLQSPILLENLSHYMAFKDWDMNEAEFLNTLCKQTGCGILLDINNVYVSSQNCGFDACDFIQAINPSYVKQCHLAGHHQGQNRLIDTHGAPIADAVWTLYAKALKHLGSVATCLEWDNAIPDWQVMLSTCDNIRKEMSKHTEPPSTKLIAISKSKSITPPADLISYQDAFWQKLHGHQDIPLADASSVHQNSMRLQRVEALQAIYPCAEHILSKERFYSIALGYALTTPSLNPDIHHHMDGFIDYLQLALDTSQSAIIDLAAFEWAWYTTFHDAPQQANDINHLAEAIKVKGEKICLQKHPKLKLLSYQSPALLLWMACQPEYQGEPIQEILDNYQKMNYYYRMHQKDGLVVAEQIDEGIYHCLQVLDKPHTLEHWCDKASELKGFDPNLGAYFYKQDMITLV